MTRSMYLDPYLDEVAAGRRVTVHTYLAGVLRGKAARYSGKYAAALQRALDEAWERGEVRPVDSVRGGVAYVRVEAGQ